MAKGVAALGEDELFCSDILRPLCPHTEILLSSTESGRLFDSGQ
jgi:hypothetical protein